MMPVKRIMAVANTSAQQHPLGGSAAAGLVISWIQTDPAVKVRRVYLILLNTPLLVYVGQLVALISSDRSATTRNKPVT